MLVRWSDEKRFLARVRARLEIQKERSRTALALLASASLRLRVPARCAPRQRERWLRVLTHFGFRFGK
jgi:hypothetical protein